MNEIRKIEGVCKYENRKQCIYGYKLGMTFHVDSNTPVTAILIPNNIVLNNIDGCRKCVVFNYGNRLKKPQLEQLKDFIKDKTKKAKIFTTFGEPLNVIKEENKEIIDIVTSFAINEKIDVQGVSKGKGYAGVMKRHNFSGGSASHGNSKAHRLAGSTGQCQDPGRLFPGTKLYGNMGNEKVTMQNLNIVDINLLDGNEAVLFVKGSIPGNKNSLVRVSHAIKKTKNQLKEVK